MSLITMRPELYTNGLKDLINYINQFQSTSEMTMVEIGSYAGEGTEIFAEHFKKVITIDPHVNGYDNDNDSASSSDFEMVIDKFNKRINNKENIEYINSTSDDAILKLKDVSFDFVYIDGWHTYEQVIKDIDNYLPQINKNGFIGGHDYNPGWFGVMKAVDEKFETIDSTFCDTSWIKKL
jgi:predicted O-methyltransferase YrrM